ncbi:MAG TPA: type III pantothenate kinase [Pirellulales bacterium]|nr:type III pantothenate kinase [Pirellulales bacterium]
MNTTTAVPLVAVDIGNSRVKLGLFESAGQRPLPEPAKILDIGPGPEELPRIAAWLPEHDVTRLAWWIGSVQREVSGRLVAWLQSQSATRITMIASSDLPLTISMPKPDRVGIDRLLDAVAVNQLRAAGQPAIIVNLGTAIKVDVVDEQGAFVGGAIMPGIATSARAMHEFTDLLPLIEMGRLDEPPAPLGKDTVGAMKAGLYWGAVGGVRELVERLSRGFKASPRMFLSGGAAPSVAPLLGDNVQYVPHLTLAGIALTAAR